MLEAAHDKSCLVAELNNVENPFWEEDEQDSPPPPPINSSTPSPPSTVPLCQNAKEYIIKRGKTFPASFLTTLLPAPGFLDNLNESLQTPTSPRLEALELSASPRLEAPQLSTSRMVNGSPPLEPLQLPACPQLDLLQHNQLESIIRWAGTNVSTADVSILPPHLTTPCSASHSLTSQIFPALTSPAWGTTSSLFVDLSNHKASS